MGLEKVPDIYVCRLVAEDPSQLGAFEDSEFDRRLGTYLLCFTPGLPLDVLGWALIEVILTVLSHDNLLSL